MILGAAKKTHAACIFTLRSGVASLEPPKFVKVSAVSGRLDARGLGGEIYPMTQPCYTVDGIFTSYFSIENNYSM